jgi:hypothetical protein
VLLAYINAHDAWCSGFFAGELHINSAVVIVRASEPVVSKHMWALNTAGQVW